MYAFFFNENLEVTNYLRQARDASIHFTFRSPLPPKPEVWHIYTAH
jgi:hypothetical protein